MLLLLASLALAAPSPTGEDLGVDFGPDRALRGCSATMEVDIGLDATVDWVWRYVFDPAGRLVSVDGKATRGTGTPRMRYSYDALGRLAVQTWDGDADGVIDRATTFAYGPDGLVRSVEASGSPSQTWYVLEAGRVVRVERDLDFDGALDTASTQVWEGDRVVQVDIDDDDDGGIDARTWYEYDALGRLVDTRYDFGADGFIDRESTEVWGPELRLAERLRDDNADGRPDSRTVLHWVCPPS